MSNDEVRKHLCAALDEIVNVEKKRLNNFYDQNDDNHKKRVVMMRPLIVSLNELKDKIGNVEGLDIDPAEIGHMATVRISGVMNLSYSISTDISNSCFEVDEFRYYTFGDDPAIEKKHRFNNPDEVLHLVVNEIGKHIASNQVLAERNKIKK